MRARRPKRSSRSPRKPPRGAKKAKQSEKRGQEAAKKRNPVTRKRGRRQSRRLWEGVGEGQAFPKKEFKEKFYTPVPARQGTADYRLRRLPPTPAAWNPVEEVLGRSWGSWGGLGGSWEGLGAQDPPKADPNPANSKLWPSQSPHLGAPNS